MSISRAKVLIPSKPYHMFVRHPILFLHFVILLVLYWHFVWQLLLVTSCRLAELIKPRACLRAEGKYFQRLL